MRYYISDIHFCHRNIELMDHRGFSSTQEMGEYIIEKWNKKVRNNDEVVILGDFSFGYGEETLQLLNRLNGHLYLIEGNHDHRFLDDKNFPNDRFEWVESYQELRDNKRKVILSHYPTFCYNGQFHIDEANGKGTSYMLYGHVHNTYDEALLNEFINITRKTERRAAGDRYVYTPCQMINCFALFSDYEPLSLDEWITLDTNRRNFINEFSNNQLLTSQKWDELADIIVDKCKKGIFLNRNEQ